MRWGVTFSIVLAHGLAGAGASSVLAREPQASRASPLIERVEITGNQLLRRDTLLFYVWSKPGDPYDERKLREDFKRLWDTGFLDDLRMEEVDGPRG